MRKTKASIQYYITLAFLFCFTNYNIGQEAFSATSGFGFTELANIGFQYQNEQTKYGFSIGIIPWSEDTYLSILCDIHLHFGEFSKLSNSKPWYFRFGLDYYKIKKTNEGSYKIQEMIYLIFRIGREFNISKKMGFYFDLGANIKVKYNSTDNYPKPTEPLCCQGMRGVYEDYLLLPAFGLGIFYKL